MGVETATGERKPRFLVAFDFDNTLISHPRETVICVQPLFPGGTIPKRLMEVKRTQGWTQFVRETYKELFRIGVSKEAILGCLSQQQLLPGMLDQLRSIRSSGGAVAVVTDSFDASVAAVAAANAGLELDRVCAAQSAAFSRHGELVLTDNDHGEGGCSVSARRSCKGRRLKALVAAMGPFELVCYAGDGANDFCACAAGLDASRGDVAMPRRGHRLAAMLAEAALDVDVQEWADGHDIRRIVQQRVEAIRK